MPFDVAKRLYKKPGAAFICQQGIKSSASLDAVCKNVELGFTLDGENTEEVLEILNIPEETRKYMALNRKSRQVTPR